MKMKRHQQRALTFIEVCVAIGILALLLSVLLPRLARTSSRPSRLGCTNRLKQVGLAYRLWSNDHEDQYPFSSTNTGSSIAWINSPEVFRHYQVMSNELVTPKVLVCTEDGKRKQATSFDDFSNANLSYFVGLDAREDAPHSILSGDRNITGGTLSNGFLRVLNADSEAGWTKEIHQNAGNVGLGDGSVQQLTPMRLRQQIAWATTNRSFLRLAVP